MAEMQKGVITQFVNGMPVVRPFGSGDALTPPLVNRAVDWSIPGWAVLYAGNIVVFTMFEDGTGVILAKF